MEMQHAALIRVAAAGVITVLLLVSAIIWLRLANRITKAVCSAARFDVTVQLARVYVFAAEQIFGDGKGEQKFEYVKNALAKEGITADDKNDHDRVKALIEAAVRELKYLEQN
ncbi:MAG: phage holin, LLH family [Eubacteriales bacterium]|nr:hypothetical protein [Clostridiales bacterium]